jgi:hypothetical protein
MEKPTKKQKKGFPWSSREIQLLQQVIQELSQDATTKIIMNEFKNRWKIFIENENPTDQERLIQRKDSSIHSKIDEIKKGGRKLKAKWSNEDISFLLQCFPERDKTKQKYRRRTEDEFNPFVCKTLQFAGF